MKPKEEIYFPYEVAYLIFHLKKLNLKHLMQINFFNIQLLHDNKDLTYFNI